MSGHPEQGWRGRESVASRIRVLLFLSITSLSFSLLPLSPHAFPFPPSSIHSVWHGSGFKGTQFFDGPTLVTVNAMIRSISKIDDYKMVSPAAGGLGWMCARRKKKTTTD